MSLFSELLTGDIGAHFSYAKLQRGELVISGLPSGIDLKKAGNIGPLGKAKCRALLAAEGNIVLTGM